MISNIDLQGPSPNIGEMFHKIEKALVLNHQNTKDALWRIAILLANGGTMPDLDEIKRRATQIIDKEGTTYLLWDHPPIKQGDSVDLNYAIAELKKPTL